MAVALHHLLQSADSWQIWKCDVLQLEHVLWLTFQPYKIQIEI